MSDLPDVPVQFAEAGEGPFRPYLRDANTLGRPWARPGTPGLEHRIGGLEKSDGTGNVDYDAANHEHMIRTRAEKVERVGRDFPATEVVGPETGDLLVLGWGGTFGAIRSAVLRAHEQGLSVAHAHLRLLNPLPADLEGILGRYRSILIPELNTGQLLQLVRSRFLVDAVGFNKVQGRPFTVEEIEDRIGKLLEVAK